MQEHFNILQGSYPSVQPRFSGAPVSNAVNYYSSNITSASTSKSSSPTTMNFRFYQPPKSSRDPDSEDDSDYDRMQLHRRSDSRDSSSPSLSSKRPGACTHCKGLKVKCIFSLGQTSCQRCILHKLECVVFGRKKRRAVATHEELLVKSHKQDLEIKSLLEMFDHLTTEQRKERFLAKSQPSSSNSSSTSTSLNSDNNSWASSPGQWSPDSQFIDTHVQSATRHHVPSAAQLSKLFYDPSANEKSSAPDIISTGLVAVEDVPLLFQIYFQFINPFFSILDPDLHVPARLFWRSHFLFTVICTIASRLSPKFINLYPSLLEFSRDAAGKALVDGKKTIDECQAFLLIAVYQAPQKKWEDQRGWLFMGIAFSLALELKINATERRPHESERDYLNRMRTWLNCYCVDASHATQFGKPAMISSDDTAALTSREWYRCSPMNLSIDVHLAAYVEMLRTMRKFKEEVAKPRSTEEILSITHDYNNRLMALYHEWSRRFADHQRANGRATKDYMCPYRADTNRLCNAYSRLVVLVHGFQRAAAHKNGIHREDPLVRQCIDTAKEVIEGMTRKLFHTGMLKYSMDAHFLFVTFAAAFLLTLLRPKFSVILKPNDPAEISALVYELIAVLESEAVVLDGRHTPSIHARFLSKQLKKIVEQLPKESCQQPLLTPTNNVPSTNRLTEQDGSFVRRGGWTSDSFHQNAVPNSPALQQSHNHPIAVSSTEFQDQYGLNSIGGYDMDFSLPYFMKTVNAGVQFAKASPSPTLPAADASTWWHNMYPAGSAADVLMDGPAKNEWPMASQANSNPILAHENRQFQQPSQEPVIAHRHDALHYS